MSEAPQVGDLLGPVRIGPVAHGGHWVARVHGRVFFVRHALSGELVTMRVTGLARRHGYADVEDILEPAAERRSPSCPIAQQCGGCDFQHVTPDHQRELKRRVVAEQLSRLAELTWEGEVEAVGEQPIRWRTRMRYRRAAHGWGLRAARSHEVVPLPDAGCELAVPALACPPAPEADTQVIVGTAAADGPQWTAPGADVIVREQAHGRSWRVSTDGFWQVHPQAAQVLTAAVLAGLEVRPGDRALDLYCGVGLFAGALVDAGAVVTGVESDPTAVRLARLNVPEARFLTGSVDRMIARLPASCELIVLDPPRRGAGATVMAELLRRQPRAVAYVACDPAALARDIGFAQGLGYVPAWIRAFDLFGSTHHVECVAVLVPDRSAGHPRGNISTSRYIGPTEESPA
ncbi:MAG: class I SAM-dependent RNA methyltransferase [Propioniciclava sp.]